MHPLATDSSHRSYFRTIHTERSAVLMRCVGEPVPGHRLDDFLRIGSWLRSVGLHTPEIYESGGDYALMEDMGDISFRAALDRGHDAHDLYGLAVDVLIHVREKSCDLVLPSYYDSHVHKARRRIVDWFMPAIRGCRNEDGLAEDYLAVWEGIEKDLPPCPQGFLHIDYHVENLMLIEGRSHLDRCGILDFQGAMRGPLPYDLANLLEDARADISTDLRHEMIDRYCAGMSSADRAVFESWYRILATQFHCRVTGQFIKLALVGKPRYLAHLPRLLGYLRDGLREPVLSPLKSWFDRQEIDFQTVPVIEPDVLRPLIRDDAF